MLMLIWCWLHHNVWTILALWPGCTLYICVSGPHLLFDYKYKTTDYCRSLVTGTSWHYVHSTCVLDSEFGFTLNCAFKKSGLFRVRNLGGIKAHVGVGNK